MPDRQVRDGPGGLFARTSLPISGAGRRGPAPPNPLQIDVRPCQDSQAWTASTALDADGWRSYAPGGDRCRRAPDRAGRRAPDPPTPNSEEPSFPLADAPTRPVPRVDLEQRAAIANRHLIDCSDTIRLHRGAAVVGARTQLITHAINMVENRQSTKPISIGRCSMVGSGCIVLGGSSLPDYSALGAGSIGSTLRSVFSDTHRVYSGVPAKSAGNLPTNARFFTRDSG